MAFFHVITFTQHRVLRRPRLSGTGVFPLEVLLQPCGKHHFSAAFRGAARGALRGQVKDLLNALNRSVSSNSIEGPILLRVSKFFTFIYALFMGFLAVFLQELGLGLGWVYPGS